MFRPVYMSPSDLYTFPVWEQIVVDMEYYLSYLYNLGKAMEVRKPLLKRSLRMLYDVLDGCCNGIIQNISREPL